MMGDPVVGLASDEDARRRIAEDLDTTLFVEAAAGTGKTQALIGRIVGLLANGRAELKDVVAVTFTEKAAGEMKLRLRSEIEAARAAGSNPRLDAAIAQLELARVGTIHAFCADLLRERPIEAGIDPLFEVVPEDEAQRLLDQAFESWFQRILEDPMPGVRRVLRRRARHGRGEAARDALRAAAGALVDHRDFPGAWRREPFDRDPAIDALLEELTAVGDLTPRASRADDYLAQSTAEIQRFVTENRLREGVRGRDYDGLEAELRDLARARSWRWKGSPRRPFGPDLPRAAVLARRDGAKRRLDDFLAAADADLAPLLQAELRPVLAEYETLKRRRGALDFLDLLLRARDLLRDDDAIRRGVQRRFSHYFVDEFQDTDPLQAEILLLLAADAAGERDWQEVRPLPGKLFFVGDPKQAIYRFRRADVAVYEAVKRQLRAHGAEVVYLRRSFRGVRPIQELVNACFAPVMMGSPDGSQAEYVDLEKHRPAPVGQPAIVALPVPSPYADWGAITNWSIERSYPVAVGAFVDWLVHDSGWKVDEGGAAVPVQPRHVCILFRRFKRFRDDVTREYVRALEVRQIPHVLVGGRSFHEREEVLAIRNALAAIEWPEDELRVFATLRGPFFALNDDVLLSFRGRIGRLHPLRRLAPEQLDDSDGQVAEALAILADLHFSRNRRPVAATIERLLAAVRAHAGIAIWPTGEQALANCLRTIDVARRFERGGARSFRAFVERLENDAERAVSEESPAVEEGTEGVRVMTVHRAKGLEFPVVILADPTCNLARETPSRHVDTARNLWAEPLCGCAPLDLLDARDEEQRRDRDEGIRIAYVAATRARDLLVVPVLGDPGAESDGWLSVLDPGVYPAPENRRAPSPAAGCPAFGGDSLSERPERAAEGHASVAPGQHQPSLGEHEVVWWDPNALDLQREQNVGLRQQSILEADHEQVAVAGGERAHEAWQTARREALRAGSLESLSPAPVTDLAMTRALSLPLTTVEVVAVQSATATAARGQRFGTLVHAVLAAVPLDANAVSVEGTARIYAALLGLDDADVRAAVPRVVAALQHPILLRAASCPARADLRREEPVTWVVTETPRPEQHAGSVLAEGVVDLAFREPGRGWTVVDFKTDIDIEPRLEEYRRQVLLYCAAIAAATGDPAKGVLLKV
jgi:ATP-dependent exoDNAse (exonuclease V) beta subunit